MKIGGKTTRSGGFARLAALVDTAVEKATYEAAQDVLSEADGNLDGPGPLVPVDIGNLRNSGYATPPARVGDRVEVEVGYGGPAAPYAATVHERVEEGINWSRPGSGPKFLENALRSQAVSLPARLGHEIAAAVRAAGRRS